MILLAGVDRSAKCARRLLDCDRRDAHLSATMDAPSSPPLQSETAAWQARQLNESILCALVAREWQWRGHSVVELAFGPRPAWLPGPATAAWITEQRAGRSMRALEQRLRAAERTVHARRAHRRADHAAPSLRARRARGRGSSPPEP